MPHEQATTRASAWTILNLLMKFGSENWQFYQQQNQRIASPGNYLVLAGDMIIVVVSASDRGNLLNNLKFEALDPILGSNQGSLLLLATMLNLTYVLTMVSMNWFRIGY